MSIFVSTHLYALGKELGVDEALEEFRRQLAEPTSESLPVVRTITRLRALDEICLWCDPGSSRIAESRCRAFHEAHASPCDVWVSCDDDIEASAQTLGWLLEAVKGNDSAICSAPYWCRLANEQEERISIQIDALVDGQLPQYRKLSDGGHTMPMRFGGFGLVAVSRNAMHAVAEATTERYRDKQGVVRLAPFIEYITPEPELTWLGEDLAFFTRVPPYVRVEALCSGMTKHQGRLLDLRLLHDGAPTIERVS